MPYTVSQEDSPWAPVRRPRQFAPMPNVADYQPTPEQRQAAYWGQLAQFANAQPRPPGGRRTIHLGLGKILTNLMAAKYARKTAGQVDPRAAYADAWKRYDAEMALSKEEERQEDRDLDRRIKESQLEINRNIANYRTQAPYDTSVTSEDRFWAAHPGLAEKDPLAYQRELGQLKGEQKMEFHIPAQPREPHVTKWDQFTGEDGLVWQRNPEDPQAPAQPVMGPNGQQLKAKTSSANPLQDPYNKSVYEATEKMFRSEDSSGGEALTENEKDELARLSGNVRKPAAVTRPGAVTSARPTPPPAPTPGNVVTVRTRDGRILRGRLDAQGNFIPGAQ
jgi:hypothetical protein